MSINFFFLFFFFGVHMLTASLPASESACIMRNVYQRATQSIQGKGSVFNHVVTGEINGAS